MARLSKDEWEKLKADFVTGVYTLEQLAKRYGVNRSTISKKANKEEWHKISIETTAELVELEKGNKRQQEIKKATKKATNVNMKYFDNSIKEITDVTEYIHNLQLSATQRIAKTLQDDCVEEIATTSGELSSVEIVERKLNPRELKSLVDAIDKAGQTLGAVPRFNNQINIQNNQSMQTLKLEVIRPNADK